MKFFLHISFRKFGQRTAAGQKKIWWCYLGVFACFSLSYFSVCRNWALVAEFATLDKAETTCFWSEIRSL